jgi:hypothetical protein
MLSLKEKRPMGGRPKKNRPTVSVRIHEDLLPFVSWLCKIRKVDQASLLDPGIRSLVVRDYQRFLPAIRLMKEAEDESRIAIGLPPTDPLPELLVLPDEDSNPRPKRKPS